jgi:Fungal tRNA ligase phosphodiesterase domain
MKKGAPGYIACILSEEAITILNEIAIHPNCKATHVTLAFRPTPDVYEKYRDLIGKEISLRITDVVSDERGQAARVEGIPSENKHPHVTISHVDMVQPAYSNELLEKEHTRVVPLNYEATGLVTWIGF